MKAKRRALCVGINIFEHLPAATLRGCVNDSQAMAGLLRERMGFARDEILLLNDAAATRDAVLKALREMIDGALAGRYGYLVFSFSSHGTQVPDLEGDERDNADEAFCTYDTAVKDDAWDRDHLIVDDELCCLAALVPKSCLFEVFMDACHSGTGLRAMDFIMDRHPRFLPPPSLQAFRQLENANVRGWREKCLECACHSQVLWAACRSDQTSADALIDGGWHGAFTHAFCSVMRSDTSRSLNRHQILQKVRAVLHGRYTQTPQLECSPAQRQAGWI